MIARYNLILASSVAERDGMALELTRDSGERVAEVFEDGATGQRTFSVFVDESVPIEAIEWLLTEAQDRL